MMKYWHFCFLSTTSCLLLLSDNLQAAVLLSSLSKSSHYHSHIHTLSHLDLSRFSPNLFLELTDKQSYQTVSVCFITDTRNCSEDRFGNLESPNGGNGGGGKPDDHGTPQELCKQAGYINTSCPEGSKPSSYCPYDSSYHSACQCLSEYNKTCDTSVGEKGVGTSCGGKYKECCNLCSDYKYTSIPSGYVSNGECQSCNGKKYKIKCDPQKYVSGSSCGSQGGSGSTCSDDYGTLITALLTLNATVPIIMNGVPRKRNVSVPLLSNIPAPVRGIREETEQLVTANTHVVIVPMVLHGMLRKGL